MKTIIRFLRNNPGIRKVIGDAIFAAFMLVTLYMIFYFLQP